MSLRRWMLVLAVAVAVPAMAVADEVVLISGTTVKQAASGRRPRHDPVGVARRGRRQARGEHDHRADRPDRLDPLRRPAAEHGACRVERGRRPAREGGRSLQEGGHRGRGEAARRAGRAVQAGRGHRRPRPGRPQPRRGGDRPCSKDSSAPSRPAGTPASALESLARLQLQKGDFAQVEKTIGSLVEAPGRGRPRGGSPRQGLGQEGGPRRGDRRARPSDQGRRRRARSASARPGSPGPRASPA